MRKNPRTAACLTRNLYEYATGHAVSKPETSLTVDLARGFDATGHDFRKLMIQIATLVYFSRLGDQKVLAVLVTRSGLVRDRVLRLDLPQSDLDLAARYINENFRGWTMESMRSELSRRIEKERSEYDRLMNSIEQLYKQGALTGEQGTQVVFIEGASNLLAGEQDRERLQEMLKTLEEKEKVVQLLGAYLDVKQEAVRVVIGLDQALPSMQNLVLIGTPARVGGEVMGSLAVLGPTRMDYQHTITAVSYIARLFDKILNESE